MACSVGRHYISLYNASGFGRCVGVYTSLMTRLNSLCGIAGAQGGEGVGLFVMYLEVRVIY